MISLEKINLESIQRKELFRSVDMKILAQEKVFLLGPSGSGKSTLLKSLVGLAPLKSGLVLWQNNPVIDWLEVRRKAMYLSAEYFNANVPVQKIIEEFLSYRLNKMELNEYMQLFFRNLNKLGLSSDLHLQSVSTLSGGERQAILISMGLAFSPRLLLLDEITSAMDKDLAYKAEKLLSNYILEKSAAYLWVTHNEDQARRCGTSTYKVLDKNLIKE